MKRLLIGLVLVCSCHLAIGQSFYYIRQDQMTGQFLLGLYDIKNCQDSIVLTINTTGFIQPYITDIAISPDGDFYLILFDLGPSTLRSIAKLDIVNNILSIVCIIPGAYNSLTCDATGTLYAANGFGFFSYNLHTGQAIDHGPVNFAPTGDLTFRNGKLYCAAEGVMGNGVVEVNITDPISSQIVFSYSLSNNLIAWGIISEVVSCDSTTTYVTVTDGHTPSLINQLYLVDFGTQSVTYLCDTPGPIVGAATANEFLASDCSVRLDLDDDNSSLAPGADYRAKPYCGGPASIAVADTDAVFYAGYRVDSLRIRLLPPAPDGAAEYLDATVAPPLSISGQNSHWLTLHNPGGAKSLDFQTAIRSVHWQNIAATVTPGPRTVEFVAFASGGRGDTALAFIPVFAERTAGRDTSVAVCADGPLLAVADLLSPSASPGGNWQPALPPNGLFEPASGASGVFQYILPAQECPGDTAQVAITVRPSPIFSLGPDRGFCVGDSVVLGPVGGSVVWQDGQSSTEYATNLPGLYWAETADAYGCRFRDSVALIRYEPVQTQGPVARCFGQPYMWHGTAVSMDTLLCDTLVGTNGCDSTYCLALSFYYPTLAVDTVICAGKSFPWQGQTLSTTGNYPDTFLLGGCRTAVDLHLVIRPPVVLSLNATICAGDTFVVGSQSFTAAGPHQVSFQTPMGCDSLVQLQLTVQQTIMTTVAANICLGGQYPWAGAYLTVPGIYTDTLQTAAGCDSVVTLTLGGLPLPVPVLSGDTLFCPGEATTLSAGPFAAYAWSTGASTAQVIVTAAGAYKVTVTNADGCTASATAQVAAYPEIVAMWETNDPLCSGGADGRVALAGMTGGQPPFHYQLGQGPLVVIPEFASLPAGLWMVTVTDLVGCAKTYSGELYDPSAWTVELSASPLLEAGMAYSIPLESTGHEPLTYVWSPAAGLSCVDCPNPVSRPDSTTTYTVIVTDADGCTQMASLTIRVAKKAPGLYVPTVFSPNDDGKNDYFNLFADPLVFWQTELLRVYDRWGGLVFEAVGLPLNQEKMGWNGQARGKDCLPGTYVFYAEVRLFDGSVLLRTGEVLLVR